MEYLYLSLGTILTVVFVWAAKREILEASQLIPIFLGVGFMFMAWNLPSWLGAGSEFKQQLAKELLTLTGSGGPLPGILFWLFLIGVFLIGLLMTFFPLRQGINNFRKFAANPNWRQDEISRQESGTRQSDKEEFCKNCGSKQGRRVNFCNNCGSRV